MTIEEKISNVLTKLREDAKNLFPEALRLTSSLKKRLADKYLQDLKSQNLPFNVSGKKILLTSKISDIGMIIEERNGFGVYNIEHGMLRRRILAIECPTFLKIPSITLCGFRAFDFVNFLSFIDENFRKEFNVFQLHCNDIEKKIRNLEQLESNKACLKALEA